MEAREFFRGSPMHEITVTGTRAEWSGLLLDVIHMREQIHYYRSMRAVDDDGEYDYELSTGEFIDEMAALGVTY